MRIFYLLFTFALAFTSTTMYAGDKVNTEDNAAGSAWMSDHMMDKASMKAQKKLDRQLLKAEKKQYRFEKRMNKFMNFLNPAMAKTKDKKALGGLDDPTDKWLWYGIILGGIAIVFWIIATAITGRADVAFWVLGTLAFLGGAASVIYWVIQKYG